MRAKNYYPPTTKIKQNPNGFGAIRTFLMTCMLMIGFTVAGYAANPTYVLPSPQSIVICQESGVYNFESLLTATDPDLGETLTWSINGPTPTKGSVLFSGNTASSGVGPVGPTSFTYTPFVGETGADVINILLSDGANSVVMTINVTINPLPTTITGPTSVCRTQSIQLGSTPANGTWSSSDPAQATVDLNSGVVTGAGGANGGDQNVTITYTLPTGCTTTSNVTIHRLSEINLSATHICAYSGTVSANVATIGGVWSSTTAPVATTNFLGTNASIDAQGAGTAIITYTMPTGCADTATLIVDPLPDPIIVGNDSVCQGLTISLSDVTPGGTWISGDNGIAVVDNSGNVTGVSGGTVNITYQLPTGCMSMTTIVVGATPTIGTSNACIGQPITLFATPGGGTWTTSSTNIALSPSGDVIGFSAGTADVTYTTPAGCVNSASLTINPAPGSISGITTICQGTTVFLSDPTPGGTWSSDNGNVTIDVNTGEMTGVSGGTSEISYVLTTGCYATTNVTVNPLGTITGPDQVCKGATVTLGVTIPAGGTWSSSNANATIDPVTGDLTGVDVGTTTITYSTSAGCFATRTQFINPLPDAITGTTTVCVGSTTTLSDAGGGTWMSADPFIAPVDMNTGVVTGNSAGDVEIVYTLPTGCTTSTTVTVHPNDAIIGGGGDVCIGNTVTLSNPNTGGTWSSANTTITIDPSSGVVTGVAAGTADITYTTIFGCTTFTTITVNPLPGAITGTKNVCEGESTQLFDLTSPGGAWSSSNSATATVDPVAGTVYGVSGGNVDITYTLPTGCFTTTSVLVNPKGEITGILFVCLGKTTTLSSSEAGIWTIDPLSPLPYTATVGTNSGDVTGISNSGYTVIDFITVPGGCVSTTTVVTGTLPPIQGPSEVCEKATITLTDIVTPGTWTSDNTGLATVDPITGVVTGVAAGNLNIIYTQVTGCSVSKNITVNPVPVIPVSDDVCQLSTINLSEPGGGLWSTTDTTVIITPIFGVVFGVTPGPAIVTYTFNGTGCYSTTSVTVNPIPEPITGNLFVCPGLTTTLSDATPGGTWTSSTPSNATVDPLTGVVTGVSTGISLIQYTLSTGCSVFTIISVQNTTPPILGPTPSEVCVGQTIQLTNFSTGGTWSSNLPGVGTVDNSGVVTGVSSGTAIITYSLGASCNSILPVQVDALSDITGPSVVCVNSSIALSDATFGGSWQMGALNPGLATVDASTGVLTGLAGGTTTVEYVLPTGCTAIDTITVNPLPTAISGVNPGVCMGDSIQLTNGVPGGTWTSSNTSVATVNTTTGWAYSVATGVTAITYSLATGCGPRIDTLHVNELPVLLSTHTPHSICNNDLFSYTPTTSAGIITFEWKRLSNPRISTPLNTGSVAISEILENTTADSAQVFYAITLTNVPTGCYTFDTIMVVVNATPRLLTNATSHVCDSSLFEFTSTSATPGVTYSWFRDAVTGISNPAASGTGDVISEYLKNTTTDPIVVTYLDTLWVDGCWHVDTVQVTVNPTPRLNSGLTVAPICDSAVFVYNSTSLTSGVTFTWFRPAVTGISNPATSGTGDVINEALFNTTPNPVVVTYLDTLWFDGCFHVDSVKVTVNPTPRLSSPVNAPAICDSVVFNYTPTSATTGAAFTWTRDYTPGISLLAGSGTGNPNEVLVNTTNIDVTVTYHYTISANFCSHDQDVRVVVHPRPRLSSDAGPLSVCSNTPFIYLPTGYVLGTTFAWSRPRVAGISPNTGNGTGQIIETLVDSFLTPVTVNYEIVMTANGCKDSTSLAVVVNPGYNVPAITTHPSEYVCMHTMLQNFGVANPAPAGVQYTWTAKNATVWATGTPDQYALVSFDSTAGDAYVTVSSNVLSFGCSNSRTFHVGVATTRAEDIQIIYYNGQLMCLNNDQDSYQWGYDDAVTVDSTLIAGETNQTYFINAPDFVYRRYWVITKHNGCEQKSYYNAPVGVNDINADAMEVKIYPNPASDVLNVDINTKAGGKFEIEVVDVLGQKISTVTPVNHRAKINVASLAPGVYMVECYRDGVKFNASRFTKN